MANAHRTLAACLAAGALLFLLAGESQAQIRRYRPRLGWRPNFPPNRMPGWDEKYIYPWSPYNIGRNPYNPGPYPSPYPVYVPSYVPYPVPVYQASAVSSPAPPESTADSTQEEFLPEPTGPIRVPPATAAAIRLRVPDAFAEVQFDGVDTSSVGRTRYYVTPDLPTDQPYQYAVTVRWQRGGAWTTVKRTLEVRRGTISTLDVSPKQTAQG
jgi:uncharacterized protein (TIGR03000 family)